MSDVHALGPLECEPLLRAGVAGRVTVSTPDGPHLVPVPYVVLEGTIVMPTSPYSVSELRTQRDARLRGRPPTRSPGP